MTEERFSVLSPKAPVPSSSYSQAIATGNLLVTSGYLGTHPDGTGIVPGGFEPELRQALDNVTAVLEEAGCAWEHVVRINVSLVDIARFEDMDRVFSEYAVPPFPSRNTIGVKELWGGGQVGIDVIAVLPERTRRK